MDICYLTLAFDHLTFTPNIVRLNLFLMTFGMSYTIAATVKDIKPLIYSLESFQILKFSMSARTLRLKGIWETGLFCTPLHR